MAENPQGMNVVGFDPALKPAIDKLVERASRSSPWTPRSTAPSA